MSVVECLWMSGLHDREGISLQFFTLSDEELVLCSGWETGLGFNTWDPSMIPTVTHRQSTSPDGMMGETTMHFRTNRQTDGRIDTETDRWVNGEMDGWLDGWMDGLRDDGQSGRMNGWMDYIIRNVNIQSYSKVKQKAAIAAENHKTVKWEELQFEIHDESDGWVERWMGEWMERWMGGWMERWIDGWINFNIRNIKSYHTAKRKTLQ